MSKSCGQLLSISWGRTCIVLVASIRNVSLHSHERIQLIPTSMQTYCRLAELSCSIENRSSSSASPTGQLPALEDDQGLRLSFMENENDEFEAARHVIDALKKHKDLDVALDSTQKAQGAAFLALIRLYLEPASIWTSWGENVSFNQHLKAVVAADLPFPLGSISAFSQKRAALRLLQKPDPYTIYTNAASCYDAISNLLDSDGRQYLLGSQASSIDAFLYGHLCLHLRAPTSSPELRNAVETRTVLLRYAQRLAQHFDTPLPPPPPPSRNPEWERRRSEPDSNGRGSKRKAPLSQAEIDRRRRNWYWLGVAFAAFAGYVFLSGQVIEFEYPDDDGEEE